MSDSERSAQRCHPEPFDYAPTALRSGQAARTTRSRSRGTEWSASICHPERSAKRVVEGRAIALFAFLALALSIASGAARADTIVYTYPALPGPVANCVWFDDNINDRAIDALIRQTDLIYNRATLPAGLNVAVTQSATTAAGAQEVAFDVNRRLLCADSAAFHQEPAPSPSPSASP